jgi:VWFA-related protein
MNPGLFARRLPILLLLPALLAAQQKPGPAAQPTPAPVSETAEVVLVEVPARVLDREDRPVKGLTAADFELYDDGHRQEILGFDAIDLAQKGAADGESGMNPAARRHFLLLFDLTFARPRAVLSARRAAKEFVLSGMGDRDFAAVATFSVEKGIRLLVTFTADRVQLARAIDTLGLTEPSALAGDPLSFLYDVIATEGGGNDHGQPDSARRSEAQAAGILETLQTLASIERARLDQHARGQIARLTESLGGMARALDAVQGRKDVIYLSEGFEGRLLVGTKNTDQEREWLLSGEAWKVDVEKTFGNSNLQSQIREMTELFRRSDCVIHAVDIAGLQADADVALYSMRGENALFEIAHETGGELLKNDNDFRAQLSRLIARTNLVYVLAFRPSRTGTPDKYHVLKVRVRTPGAHVSARAGYYERRAFRGRTALERSLAAADLLANETPVSDLPTHLRASVLPGKDSDGSVPVLVEVPGPGLLAAGAAGRLPLEIYAYAYDAENRVRDFFAQNVGVDIAVVGPRLNRGPFTYSGALSLPPGDYRIRILVRDGASGRMGLAAETVHVPDFSGNRPYLAAPLFLASPEQGLFVPGRAPGVSPDLVVASAQGLVPSALPEVAPGARSRLSVLAFHFPDTGTDSLRIGAQVLSAEGRPLKEGTIAVLGQSPTGAKDRRALLVGFTPPDLAPGRYALRVIVQDSAGRGAQASAPFLVR